MKKERTSVLIVSAVPLLRCGIAAILSSLSCLTLCAETEEAACARRLCEEKKPSLIVVDLDLPDGSGLGLLRDFAKLHPPARIFALSECEDARWLERAIRAGAAGYMSKYDDLSEFRAGQEALREGKLFLSTRMSRQMLRQMTRGKPVSRVRKAGVLSDREMQIFRLIANGQSTQTMARGLCLSVKTVETHCARIKIKLGVVGRAALKRCAAAWFNRGPTQPET